MNVVMLGDGGVGKTTYVSLMYRILADGVGGFSCRADGVAVHEQLIKAGEAVLTGSYPPPTSARSVHDLVLRHKGRDVLPFRWSDYRGGALHQRRADSRQARELHQDLMQADGIVLFADAPRQLSSGGGLVVRRMASAVLRSLGERDERSTPLVIAFTKCDLVNLGAPGTADRLREPFGELIGAVARTRHIRGAVVPLVCGPKPADVQVPALWVLRYGIQGRTEQLRRAADEWQAKGRRAAERDTWRDRFESWVRSEETWRSISRRHYANARAERARIEPLTEPAGRLASLLREVASF